jgi:hypothetical protein
MRCHKTRHRRCFLWVLALCLALSVIPKREPVYADTWQSDSFPEETVVLINEFRVENGLAPLKLVPELLDITAARAVELQESYGHLRPDGSDWFSIVEASNTLDSNCYAAENIAAGYTTPEETVEAWIDSPAHREALLSENYSYCGVGTSYLENDPNEYYSYWDLILISAKTEPEGAWLPGSENAQGNNSNATVSTQSLLYGDLNLDTEISLADVVLLQQIVSQQVTPSATQEKLADCYTDNVLDQKDCIALMDFLLQIIPQIPLSE